MAPSRRQLLRSGIAAAAFGIAGCSSGGTDQSTDTGSTPTPTQTATSTPTQTRSQQQQNTACGPAVEVSGDITQDTTWDCRYRMTGDVTVTNGATLTVDGAQVEAEQDTILSVEDGTLVTDGTTQQPAIFRSIEGNPGGWKGIEITADSTNSSLRNALVIEGGASGWANVYVQNGATVSIDGCGFNRSATYGIDAEENATLQQFENCSFFDNQTRPMRVPATTLDSLDTSSTYTNGADSRRPGGVDVRNETVTTDAIWAAIDDAYHFPDGAVVESLVTIEPGADLRFGQSSRFSVETGGMLDSRGVSDAPVTFRGEQTDTPGYWQGIEIVSDNRNGLYYTTVADAGSGGWANVYVQNGGRVRIEDSTLEKSQTYGLHAEANTTMSPFVRNELDECDSGAMRIPLANLGDVHSNTSFPLSDTVDVTAETIPGRTTWPALDTVVHFTESCSIDAPVTVDPGASFTFAQDSILSVEPGGSLNAVGTEDDPITFEGEVDVQGFWRGIEIVSLDPENVFDHCEIANGGSASWANIYIQDSGMATVRNSTLRDSSTFGIIVEDGGRLTNSNNSFGSNANGTVST